MFSYLRFGTKLAMDAFCDAGPVFVEKEESSKLGSILGS